MPSPFKKAPAGVKLAIPSIPHMSPRQLAAFMAMYGSYMLPPGGFQWPGQCGTGWVPFQPVLAVPLGTGSGSPSLATYLSEPYYKQFAVLARSVPGQLCIAMTPYYAVVKAALSAGLGIQMLWPASPWKAMSGMGVDDPAAYQPTSWWSLRSKNEKTALIAGGALASVALIAMLRKKRATPNSYRNRKAIR